jgi:uncharacterized membrane protein (DUF4010 family)
MNETDLFTRLAVALFAGFLIGAERGYHERDAPEGRRIAGVRTFGLIALLGALFAALAEYFGAAVLGLGALALGVVLLISYRVQSERFEEYGITTEVAALVTFGLGALAMAGQLTVAAAIAVVTALILALKPQLHGILSRLKAEEVYGTLQLLLISLVMLPVLPNRGFGPWEALNPYAIWWMVVLIAAMSYVGYVAVRLAGAEVGLMFTALAGGLASSTALSLNYARIGARETALVPLATAGIITASATMFPRVLVVASIVQPALLSRLIIPLGASMLAAYGAAFWFWRRSRRSVETAHGVPIRNPFELRPALQFALLLTVIMLAVQAVRRWYGDPAVYALAALSGVSDVDAITLSMARLTRHDLALPIAANAVLIAAFVNTAVKAILVAIFGGKRLALRVGVVSAGVIAIGFGALAAS